jgi:hypothetical protein
MATKAKPHEIQKRKKMFGTMRDGFRPIRPYRWRIDLDGFSDELVEIPVTTMPVVRLPIHVSYILYISAYSQALALMYFKTAMRLCRLRGIQPSLLLHPLDFLGCDDADELSFFPAMNLSSKKKMGVVSKVVDLYSNQFHVVTLQQHARALSKAPRSAVNEMSLDPR